MRKLLATLMLSLVLTSGAAQAAGSKLYFGAGVGDSTLELPGGSDMSLGTLSGKVGFRFGRFFSVEGDVGVMSDDTNSVLSEAVVNYQALLGRVGYTFDRTNVYAFYGQSRVEINRSLAFGVDGLENDTEIVNVFGAGISLFGNATTAVNFEFRYFDGGSLTTAHLGFRHVFGGHR